MRVDAPGRAPVAYCSWRALPDARVHSAPLCDIVRFRVVVRSDRARNRGDHEMAQTSGQMIDRIGAMQDFKLYRELHWEGSFEEYLEVVRERPQVTRNAYQRL